ncbi:TonB-dependent receptor plug domain-containing protein [Prevotella nanceiensis]|uniref:TonB-dependent receptor n=1 Tax=Hoylesella nanceiensis TaxID=425941 RepID=UPI001C606441|nr:TonB-dependent receptor plug domain-containing protein [Hoylesella nanceiensis]MBW4835072.1 TonB-dependent receptor plug domain-containing protein [Hoylesella nanceiensis]
MLNSILLLTSFLGTAVPNDADSTVFKTVGLSEVTVVEFKKSKENLATNSVSVVDSGFINRHELQSITELTAVVPNFYMPEYGSKQNTPVYIRGVGAKTKGSAVGFYVDGIPHFENSSFDVDMSNIASVTVFRGPQGTLYGRNAIGGIINVSTVSPLAYQGTQFKLGYGSHNDALFQFSHYNKLGSKMGYSVAGGYHYNDGFYRNMFTNKYADQLKDAYGRVALVWLLDNKWFLRVNSMLDYSNQGGYPYGKYNRLTGETEPVNYNRYSSYRRLLSTSGVNIRYAGENISFSSQTAFQYIRDRQGIDQDFTSNDTYFVKNRLKQTMLSQEFMLKSNNSSRYQWLWGAFAMTQHINNTVETQYITKDNAFPTHYRIPVNALAIYHQSTIKLFSGFSFIAGLRWDYENSTLKYLRETYQLSTDGARTEVKNVNSSLHFNQITPKFALQYQDERNNNSYYFSVTRGYKAGGFNQTFQKEEETSFGPEYNWNYELGGKVHLLKDKLYAEAALYYIDWRQQQVNQTVPGVGNVIHNAGHSSSKGFELALNSSPLKNLSIALSYGYTYAKFIEYQKSATLSYSGNMLPMVPRNTLSCLASYALYPSCASFIDKIVLTAGLTGLGKIYWAEDNEVAQNFYALLNAKISITSGIFTWECWGKNITDMHYNTYCFKSSADYAQIGKPAYFGTSLLVKF